MTSDRHDHTRPGRAAQLAAMAMIRALLADDKTAIRRAAVAGGCPACNTVAVASWVLTASGRGMTPERARAILAAVEATEVILRAEGN